MVLINICVRKNVLLQKSFAIALGLIVIKIIYLLKESDQKCLIDTTDLKKAKANDTLAM